VIEAVKVAWLYIFYWLYSLDVRVNVLLGGEQGQTLSSRMGEDIDAGRCYLCRPICFFLNFFQEDHCTKAWTNHRSGSSRPPKTEN
jgi:hypothetical protein